MSNLPAEKNPIGRPTLYKPEYCAMLITHMSGGNTFASFAKTCKCAVDTLYEWVSVYPEFSEAKKKGYAESLSYYETLGKLLATGQLKRVTKEEPVLGPDGKVQFDRSGEVVMKREFEPVQGNVTAWIFLCKNLHGKTFRDVREINVGSSKKDWKSDVEGMTTEEMENELAQIAHKYALPENNQVKDVTPTNEQ